MSDRASAKFIPKAFVFLDIDGVVNTHDFDYAAMSNPIHRDKIQLLNHILIAADAAVVLSSAWRYHFYRREMNLVGLDWLLRSHGMVAVKDGLRVIGITREDTMIPNPDPNSDFRKIPLPDERGQQITDWIVGEGWKHYGETGRHVVIDDGGVRPDGSWTDLGIRAAGHPFVQTKSDIGLTVADANKAIAILKG